MPWRKLFPFSKNYLSPPQLGPHRHKLRGTLRTALPASSGDGERQRAVHKAPRLIFDPQQCCYFLNTCFREKSTEEIQKTWGKSVCSTWASVETSLAMLFAAFLLQ